MNTGQVQSCVSAALPGVTGGRPRVIYCPPGIYGMGIQITDCDAEGSHFGISDWVGALRCDSAPSNGHWDGNLGVPVLP